MDCGRGVCSWVQRLTDWPCCGRLCVAEYTGWPCYGGPHWIMAGVCVVGYKGSQTGPAGADCVQWSTQAGPAMGALIGLWLGCVRTHLGDN